MLLYCFPGLRRDLGSIKDLEGSQKGRQESEDGIQSYMGMKIQDVRILLTRDVCAFAVQAESPTSVVESEAHECGGLDSCFEWGTLEKVFWGLLKRIRAVFEGNQPLLTFPFVEEWSTIA